jgi:hypothetical protein
MVLTGQAVLTGISDAVAVRVTFYGGHKKRPCRKEQGRQRQNFFFSLR